MRFLFMKTKINILFDILLCYFAFILYNEYEIWHMSNKCYAVLHNKIENKEKDSIGRVYDYDESVRFAFFLHDYYVIPLVMKKSYVHISFKDGQNYSDSTFDLYPWVSGVLSIMGVEKLLSIAYNLVGQGSQHSYIYYDSKMIDSNEDCLLEDRMSNSEIIHYVKIKLRRSH